MSRINRIRIVNLNYNNNAIRIDDETFDLANENTLFSLRNGGGKSVLIQMLTAPFVHKRYRDTSERPFASYFTTNQPTLILVEWGLDSGAGYVLSGMMVRQNQEVSEDMRAPDLEIINFIHEYREANDFDIANFAFTSLGDGKKTLKGFHANKTLFEQCKQNRALKFDYYDMNQPARSKSYFTKLEEYQIYAKEWEAIIKKVNLKESGLSDLFKEAKDEKGLSEKWFLEAVENKLNKDNQRMQGFEAIVKKYVLQYKANQGNFQRQAGIFSFQGLMQPLCTQMQDYANQKLQVEAQETQLKSLSSTLERLIHTHEATASQHVIDGQTLSEQRHRLSHEEHSLALYQLRDQGEALNVQAQVAREALSQLQAKNSQFMKQKAIYEVANRYGSYKLASQDVQRFEGELEIAKQANSDLLPLQANIGYSLSVSYRDMHQRELQQLVANGKNIAELYQQIRELSEQVQTLHSEQHAHAQTQGFLASTIQQFNQFELTWNAQYQPQLLRNLEGRYEPTRLEAVEQQLHSQIEVAQKTHKQVNEVLHQLSTDMHANTRALETLHNEHGQLSGQIVNASQQVEHLENEATIRRELLSYVGLANVDVNEVAGIVEALQQKKLQVSERIRQEQREYDTLQRDYLNLASGEVIEVPEPIVVALAELGIQFYSGMTWLQRNNRSVRENQALVKAQPFLPYSLIMTQSDVEKLAASELALVTPFPIPILVREQLDSATSQEVGTLSQQGNIHFYLYFNDQLLDEVERENLLQIRQRELNLKQKRLQQHEQERTFYETKIGIVQNQSLNPTIWKTAQAELAHLLDAQATNETALLDAQQAKVNFVHEQHVQQNELQAVSTQLQADEYKSRQFHELTHAYTQYVQAQDEQQQLTKIQLILETTLKQNLLKQQQQGEQKEQLKDIERSKRETLKQLETQMTRFSQYQSGTLIKKDQEDLLAEYEAIHRSMDASLQRSEADYQHAKQRFAHEENQLELLITRYQLQDDEYQQVTYDRYAEDQILHELDLNSQAITTQRNDVQALEVLQAKNLTLQETGVARLKRELNESELLPKSAVMNRDFQQLFAQLKVSETAHVNALKQNQARLALYNQEYSALIEYVDPTFVAEVDERYDDYTAKQWYELRGTLLRDYRQYQKIVTTTRAQITDEYHLISRATIMNEAFFKQPFERLLSVSDEPAAFFQQYEIIDQAFTSLLEKLAIDIELSTSEAKHVSALLLDYVGEIHKQLGLIDQNSSIRIRGKNLKMLRITLPDWIEQQSISQIRMDDFLSGVTNQCLSLLNENRNIEEFIGTQVTTKNLYDTIVG